MNHRLASFISVIFHPLWIPSFFTAFLLVGVSYFNTFIPTTFQWIIFGSVFITTFLMPAFMMFLFKRSGIISSYHMEEKEERFYPFLTTALFYYFSYSLIIKLGVPFLALITKFLLGGISLIIMVWLINLAWKISIHLTAMGGLTAGLFYLYYLGLIPSIWPLLFLILSSGSVAAARLSLKAHSPAQIYFGYLLGVIGMLGVSLYF